MKDKGSAWLLLILFFCSSCSEETSPIAVDELPTEPTEILFGTLGDNTFSIQRELILDNQAEWLEWVSFFNLRLGVENKLEDYDTLDFSQYKVAIVFDFFKGSSDYSVRFKDVEVVPDGLQLNVLHTAPFNDLRTELHQPFTVVLLPTESEVFIHHQMESPNIYPETVLYGKLGNAYQPYDQYYFIVNNQTEWNEFVDRLSVNEGLEKSREEEIKAMIDFTKSTVICAIDEGSFRTHSIDITDIIEVNQEIEVRVKGLLRRATTESRQAVHIVQIPKSDKLINFTFQD